MFKPLMLFFKSVNVAPHTGKEYGVTRNEAEKLVGQSVRVWLGADGEYVGTLRAVSGEPFWAQVQVTGVLTPATHIDQGGLSRRGWRVGETLSTRGFAKTRLSATQAAGHPSYLAALQRQLSSQVSTHAGVVGLRCDWLQVACAKALRAVMLAEERRIRTGLWLLVPAEGQLEG